MQIDLAKYGMFEKKPGEDVNCFPFLSLSSLSLWQQICEARRSKRDAQENRNNQGEDRRIPSPSRPRHRARLARGNSMHDRSRLQLTSHRGLLRCWHWRRVRLLSLLLRLMLLHVLLCVIAHIMVVNVLRDRIGIPSVRCPSQCCHAPLLNRTQSNP